LTGPISAHIAGIPVEETLMSFGPVLLAIVALAIASAGERLRRIRGRVQALRGLVPRAFRRRPRSG
jgi:hypothetical protein